MSEDLISRQDAINEIRLYFTVPNISDDETKIEGYNDGLEMAISILSDLSSAEPERKIQIEAWTGVEVTITNTETKCETPVRDRMVGKDLNGEIENKN